MSPISQQYALMVAAPVAAPVPVPEQALAAASFATLRHIPSRDFSVVHAPSEETRYCWQAIRPHLHLHPL
jgi:hypothetical protein